MKNILIVTLLFLATISLNAQDSVAGIWNTGEDNTRIEITENDGVATGKILSSDNANVTIGNQILRDITFSDGEWSGQLYATRKGEWYDAVLNETDDKLDITIKVGWMSKTITWTEE